MKKLMANQLRQEIGGGALARRERILGNSRDKREVGEREQVDINQQIDELQEHTEREKWARTEER